MDLDVKDEELLDAVSRLKEEAEIIEENKKNKQKKNIKSGLVRQESGNNIRAKSTSKKIVHRQDANGHFPKDKHRSRTYVTRNL